MDYNSIGVDIRDATHVVLLDSTIEKIKSKWGISVDGHLAKPSDGGFGVVTESGRRVSMREVKRYLQCP